MTSNPAIERRIVEVLTRRPPGEFRFYILQHASGDNPMLHAAVEKVLQEMVATGQVVETQPGLVYALQSELDRIHRAAEEEIRRVRETGRRP